MCLVSTRSWELFCIYMPAIDRPLSLIAGEAPSAAIFHEDGCYEDSNTFLRRSRYCEWGIKRVKHTGVGPGLPWPGELGPLGMES